MQTCNHNKMQKSTYLPDEPHSRCSTAKSHTTLLYCPMLITVLFPPFSEVDIKLQDKKSNRESTENMNMLTNIIQ